MYNKFIFQELQFKNKIINIYNKLLIFYLKIILRYNIMVDNQPPSTSLGMSSLGDSDAQGDRSDNPGGNPALYGGRRRRRRGTKSRRRRGTKSRRRGGGKSGAVQDIRRAVGLSGGKKTGKRRRKSRKSRSMY